MPSPLPSNIAEIFQIEAVASALVPDWDSVDEMENKK